MTISRFEAGQGETHQATRTVIQAVLEASGVEFIFENGGGAGVRMKTPQSSAKGSTDA